MKLSEFKQIGAHLKKLKNLQKSNKFKSKQDKRIALKQVIADIENADYSNKFQEFMSELYYEKCRAGDMVTDLFVEMRDEFIKEYR